MYVRATPYASSIRLGSICCPRLKTESLPAKIRKDTSIIYGLSGSTIGPGRIATKAERLTAG
jgi:hypothetical protein